MESAYRQLVLCPADDSWVPASPAEFAAILQRQGVLGQSVGEDSQARFLIGDAFLQLFSFMGCAPSIELQPKDGSDFDWHSFVFIQLSPVQAQSRWLVDRDNAKPACPHCQRRTREWTQYYHAGDASLRCPHCQRRDAVCRWRWFDAGACARQFVSIAPDRHIVVTIAARNRCPLALLLSQRAAATRLKQIYC
jgi:hypothetical protein